MPFLSEQIAERFQAGAKSQRLGHAYLLTGAHQEELEGLARQLATVLLGAPTEEHPDFYLVQPQSKSRRITVEQMRGLEKSLYLKPFKAPRKVALIASAERMCVGQAEAANAFLKTLEEPPAQTTLFLLTTRPALLLPTILSRCLRIDLFSELKKNELFAPLLEQWFKQQPPGPVRAYARANALHQFWQGKREELEEELTSSEEEAEESIQKAMLEGELQLIQQETIAALQREYWARTKEKSEKMIDLLPRAFQAVTALEELQHGLQLNLDPHLALERACLKIEGLI